MIRIFIFKRKKRIMAEIIVGMDKLEVEPNFGPDTSTFYITTDLANQYMIQLIQEKNNEEGVNFAMTEGIILSGTEDKDILRLCSLLEYKYKQLETNRNVEGIYTVLNIAPSLRKPAHQNWIFYDISNKRLIRFEPNGPSFDYYMGYEYRIKDLFDCVSNRLNVEWEFSDNANINPFNGCRATSTILALMHLLGLDYRVLSERSNAFLRTLALQVSRSIQSQKCSFPSLPRSSRRTKELLTYIEPENKEGLEPVRSVGMSRLVEDEVSVEDTIIQSDRNLEAFDFSSKTNAELIKYLLDRDINPGFRSSRLQLIEKILAHQNALIFT